MGLSKHIKIKVKFHLTDESENITLTDDEKQNLISKLPVPETGGMCGWFFYMNKCSKGTPGYTNKDESYTSYMKPKDKEGKYTHVIQSFYLSWYGYQRLSTNVTKTARKALNDFVISKLVGYKDIVNVSEPDIFTVVH